MTCHGTCSDTVAAVEHVSRSHLRYTGSLPRGVGESGGAVLALDLGTSTGWAIRSPDKIITSGTVNLKGGRFEGGGMRYLRFRHWLDGLKKLGDFERIAFEEVRRHAGVDAAHVYGGLLATLTAWGEHHRIPYEGVPIGTWKKALCGRGNASKGEVIAAVVALGFLPANEDEADALGILLSTTGGDMLGC